MSHKSKYRRVCGNRKGQDCYTCARKQKIVETKLHIIVTCDAEHGQRTIKFFRGVSDLPYCAAWKESI